MQTPDRNGKVEQRDTKGSGIDAAATMRGKI